MTTWGSFNKVVLNDVLSQLGFKESDRDKIEAPSAAGVNFTNILCTAFLFRFILSFWSKKIGVKAAPKMLVKLTPGHVQQRNPKDLTFPIWITLSADFFIGIAPFCSQMTSQNVLSLLVLDFYAVIKISRQK
jgi:hypothetical protein